MNVSTEPVSVITEGHILSLEHRGQGADAYIVGSLRTSGSFGTLYRFRAIWRQNDLLEAYRSNKAVRLSGVIADDNVYRLDGACRLVA